MTKIPKIFDCFTYFNEDMMLKIRLNQLNKYVDNAKLHIRSKFAIQNAIDKIQEMEA